MLSVYTAMLRAGKPRWLERATASGLVATLLRQVKRRKRGALLNAHGDAWRAAAFEVRRPCAARGQDAA
jgi:uncharacterized protein (DUF2252 family)